MVPTDVIATSLVPIDTTDLNAAPTALLEVQVIPSVEIAALHSEDDTAQNTVPFHVTDTQEETDGIVVADQFLPSVL
jgi:hypothetical protein